MNKKTILSILFASLLLLGCKDNAIEPDYWLQANTNNSIRDKLINNTCFLNY